MKLDLHHAFLHTLVPFPVWFVLLVYFDCVTYLCAAVTIILQPPKNHVRNIYYTLTSL